jgi:Lhr-like helicase
VTAAAAADGLLPPAFAAWFASRGWQARPFQLALIEAARAGEHVLLTAPTGGGKTLAGFLPSLIELAVPRAPSTVASAFAKGSADKSQRSSSSAKAGAENPIIALL